jgi:hypothetical protein
MKHLRVIDQAGNKTDYETEFVPRIGERILLEYGIGGGPVRPRYFRVKDVMYRLQNSPDAQAAILIEEDSNAEHWPD